MNKLDKDKMPDVTKHSSSMINSTIDWVGMDKISVPVMFESEQVLADVNVYVNIVDPSAKGIHMSRLYLAIGTQLLKQNISAEKIKETVTELVNSQKGLSDKARLELSWKQPLNRKALLSEYSGWKPYPVRLKVIKDKNSWSWSLEFALYYSSTCPCSAALSRQLFQKQFKEDFGADSQKDSSVNIAEVVEWLGQKQVASAHSQRSRADVKLKFKSGLESVDFIKYADAIEQALKTPVQTAVKREDEQEFARLNGENQMFCRGCPS